MVPISRYTRDKARTINLRLSRPASFPTRDKCGTGILNYLRDVMKDPFCLTHTNTHNILFILCWHWKHWKVLWFISCFSGVPRTLCVCALSITVKQGPTTTAGLILLWVAHCACVCVRDRERGRYANLIVPLNLWPNLWFWHMDWTVLG